MAEQKNPFDVSELMQMFDPNRFMEQGRQIMQQYGMPPMDMQALMEAQRRNVEAVVAANRTLMEGTETLMRHQSDLMREVFEEVSQGTRQVVDEDPEKRTAHQMALVERIYDRMSGHLQEASRQVLQAQEASMKQLDDRFRESLKELQRTGGGEGKKPSGTSKRGGGGAAG
ncbi:MAG: phasin family protein [Ectothiorhodospira sp.]